MDIKKPIVFFDLETTGVDISADRIVQIGAIKTSEDGSEEVKNVLVNPTINIPESATEIHGISNDDVKDSPTFKQISKSLFEWLTDCDLAGYNSDNFDVPLLIEEFNRVNIEFPKETVCFVDVLKVERQVCSHKLEETYKRYTGKALDGAHDALVDIRATIEILNKQMELNSGLPASVPEIDAFCQGETRRVDFAGKLYEKAGLIYWGFGKNKDRLVSETEEYANWVLGANFPKNTKKHIKTVFGLNID